MNTPLPIITRNDITMRSLGSLVDQYLKLRADASPNTTSAIKGDLTKLINHLTMSDDSITIETCYNFKLAITADYSPRTVARILSSCRDFFGYLLDSQIIQSNPFTAKIMRGPKIDRYQGPYVALTDSEVRSLLGVYYVGTPQYLALYLSFTLGLRVSELVSIRFKDINNGVLTVRGKGNKVRHIAMPDTMQGLIDGYKNESSNGYLVRSEKCTSNTPTNRSTVWRWFQSAAKTAGIDPDRVCPHGARATQITKGLDSGLDIRTVANMAGHSDVGTTMIYDKKRGSVSKDTVSAIKY